MALKLINGLPTYVEAYDEVITYASGLAANTPITLPSSGSFSSSSAKDLLVIYNNLVADYSGSFTVVGAGPSYTQIQFTFALPNDSKVRFRKEI